MDAVEIVMAVEEAFDIRIEDAEAAKVLTPRQLIDLVLSKVAVTTTETCLTHRAFNLLRKSFQTTCGIPRAAIAPSTMLGALLPGPSRRALLGRVINDLGITDNPALVRPNWITTLLAVASLFAGLLAVLIFPPGNIPFGLAIIAIVAAATAWIGAQLTKAQRTELDIEPQTIGELSRWVVGHKSDLAGSARSGWTRDQVAARVREIVIEILACESNFREEADFIHDLGLS